MKQITKCRWFVSLYLWCVCVVCVFVVCVVCVVCVYVCVYVCVWCVCVCSMCTHVNWLKWIDKSIHMSSWKYFSVSYSTSEKVLLRSFFYIKCVHLKPKRKFLSATLSKYASACSSSADSPCIYIKFCSRGYKSCAGNLFFFFRMFRHHLDETQINAYQIFSKIFNVPNFSST